jgi:MOSC domain-containing protein YiiM
MATVTAVSAAPEHGFTKRTAARIRLVTGLGVEGDAHLGRTVQHLSRVAREPTAPNLRQVHLLHSELLDDLGRAGHRVAPGDLGENLTTTGLELLGLPVGAVLAIGESAEVELTGLRNPCYQIDDFQDGLLRRVLRKDADGSLVRLAGVMGVVRRGGVVRAGDTIGVALPEPPLRRLDRV